MVRRLAVPWAALGAAFLALLWPLAGNAAEAPATQFVARITGVVVDEHDQPAPGVEVFTPKDRKDTTTTDKEGKFVLDLKHSKSPNVCYTDVAVMADGGKRVGAWSVQDTFGATVDGRIPIKPGREFRVKVVDGDAKPVADAEVAVDYHGMHWVFTGGRTDAKGEVTLWLPTMRKLRWVAAVKHGVGMDYAKGEQLIAGDSTIGDGKPLELQLKLEGAQQIILQAKDTQGRFVSDANFCPLWLAKKNKTQNNGGTSLYFNEMIRDVLPSMISPTNAQGEAVVDWLPRDASYATFTEIGLDWFVASGTQPTLNTAQGKGPLSPLSAPLLGMVRLPGKVVKPDGSPASDMVVQIEGHGRSSLFRKYAHTAADGTFEIPVWPDHEYSFAVQDTDWSLDSRSALFVGEGDTLGQQLLNLKKGTLVHGKVIGGTGKRNDLGVSVTLRSGSKQLLTRWASTDPQGEYSIRLGSGSYWIGCYGSKTRDELVVENEERIEKNFDLTDP
jgi:hypothetical protein